MRAWGAVLVMVILAGCANTPPANPKVTLLNPPKLMTLLLNETLIPEGFRVGFSADPREADAAGTLSQVYDYAHNNATTQHSLRIGVTRFDSIERARQECADQARAPSSGAAPVVTTTGMVVRDDVQGDPKVPESFGQTTSAFACDSIYVAWALEGAMGEHVLSNSTALVRSMLDRIDATHPP